MLHFICSLVQQLILTALLLATQDMFIMCISDNVTFARK